MQNKVFLRIIFLFFVFFQIYVEISPEIIAGKANNQSNKNNFSMVSADDYVMAAMNLAQVVTQGIKAYGR